MHRDGHRDGTGRRRGEAAVLRSMREAGAADRALHRVESRYCVMFISRECATEAWTRWERRSALARVLEEDDEYVPPGALR